jgi:hypothetical protein
MLELETLVAAAQEASNFVVASKASWFEITDELPQVAEY